MKVNIDIPDWAASENLYLITRSELVARKMVGDNWKVKSVRCNKCGECCKHHPIDGAYFPLTESGECINLVVDGDRFLCRLGMDKPLACVVGEPEGSEYTKFGCCVDYK